MLTLILCRRCGFGVCVFDVLKLQICDFGDNRTIFNTLFNLQMRISHSTWKIPNLMNSNEHRTRFGYLSTNGFRGGCWCFLYRNFLLFLLFNVAPAFIFASKTFYNFICFNSLQRKAFETEKGKQTQISPHTQLYWDRIASKSFSYFILFIFIATWTWAKTASTICWCVHFNTSCCFFLQIYFFFFFFSLFIFGDGLALMLFFPWIFANKNATHALHHTSERSAPFTMCYSIFICRHKQTVLNR